MRLVLVLLLLLAPAMARAAPLQLTIVIRGQSNAYMLNYFGGPALRAQVQSLLGFDGATARVNLIADAYVGNNLNTINPGTALIGDWLTPVGGDWRNGWTPTALEQGLLNDLAGKPADVRAAPTAVVWLHNEYDSRIAGLTTDQWVSALRYDSGRVRATLGQAPGRVPYMFVNAIPWSQGSDASNQAIKLGMQQLAADSSFVGRIAGQSADVNMTFNFQTFQDNSWYGIDHMDQADVLQLVDRLARSLANQWAKYAKPGSPVANAGGHLAAAGPRGIGAKREASFPNRVLVTLAYDTATALQPLSAGAKAGLGWTLRRAGATQAATSATQLDATHLELQFAAPVPKGAGVTLYYSYGVGRIARPATAQTPSGFPGRGNGIYDSVGMPLWVRAAGLPVGAP